MKKTVAISNNLAQKEGALPSQTIFDLIKGGFIKGTKSSNVKPSSLDLSVSSEIYEVEGIFQPKKSETVRQVLEKIKRKKHSIQEPLLCEKVYLIRLNESLALPKGVYGFCNPKSTSGRIDIHVRLLTDRTPRYDTVLNGAKTELWISIIPKTFPVKIFEGISLNQLRFFTADTRLSDLELDMGMDRKGLLWRRSNSKAYKSPEIYVKDNDNSIILTLDLENEMLGFEGVKSNKVLDLSKVDFYNSKAFFKPVRKQGNYVYLKSGSFYILSTHEAVRVPPELACEMVPMDERSGEFRSHYAGFIDPGWGWGKSGEGKGRPLTLEVRPFEDIIVRQGQPIAKIRFERMTEIPDTIYDAMNSNYTVQSGPRLAKHFKKK